MKATTQEQPSSSRYGTAVAARPPAPSTKCGGSKSVPPSRRRRFCNNDTDPSTYQDIATSKKGNKPGGSYNSSSNNNNRDNNNNNNNRIMKSQQRSYKNIKDDSSGGSSSGIRVSSSSSSEEMEFRSSDDSFLKDDDDRADDDGNDTDDQQDSKPKARPRHKNPKRSTNRMSDHSQDTVRVDDDQDGGGSDDDDGPQPSRSAASSRSLVPPKLPPRWAYVPNSRRRLVTLVASSAGSSVSDDVDLLSAKFATLLSTTSQSSTKHPGTVSPNPNLRCSSSGGGSIRHHGIHIPAAIFRKLFDYQRDAVEWMMSLHTQRIGGILADSMGMGKTFMTLTLISGLMKAGTIRNALIVAPVSVLRSWEKESNAIFATCFAASSSSSSFSNAPSSFRVRVVTSDTNKKARQRAIQQAMVQNRSRSGPCQLVITSYGLVQSSTDDFIIDDRVSRGGWDYVILDEGHQIKNPNALRSKAVRKVCTASASRVPRRLMLTGTPILNKLEELWSVVDFATSGKVLGRLRDFNGRYGRPIEAARNKDASDGTIQFGQRMNTELQEKIKPYVLQRRKEDYLRDKLPPKYELVIWTHLSERQRELYTEFVTSRDSIVRDIIRGLVQSPLEGITWLKKLCGHPLLAESKASDADALGTALRDVDVAGLLEQSPKLCVLVDLVHHFISEGHRTLVFSQSTRMLDIVESALFGVNVLRIDGSTQERDRQTNVDMFNDTNGASFVEVMLLSTKAAGVGLTLTGADRVIVYDPSWTPAEDDQAVDRAYRIGQDREVIVYRLIAAGTVEEKMYEKQIHKDGIRRTVLTEGVNVDRHFSSNELQELFKLGEVGRCEFADKFNREGRALVTDTAKHSFVLSHDSVVALTRHDGVYASTGDSFATAASSSKAQPPSKVVQGRARKVLARDNADVVAVGGPPSKQNDRCMVAAAKADATDREKENAGPGNRSLSAVLELAETLEQDNQPRKAVQALSQMLEEPNYSSLSSQEKMLLHEAIAPRAHDFGFL